MLSRTIRFAAAAATWLAVSLSALPESRASAQGMVIPHIGVCLPGRPCGVMAAPAVERTSSQVVATLADRVVHYEVTETFANFGPRVAEADYVFPLPAGAAFQDLQLSINGQLVAGEALNATEARGVYEEIVRRLRDPALVEWMGTGLLRARIFPIAPNEVKKVVVRFQTVAQREGDAIRVDYAGSGPTNPRATYVSNRQNDSVGIVAAPPTFFTLVVSRHRWIRHRILTDTHTPHGTRRRPADDSRRRRASRYHDPAASQPQRGGGGDNAPIRGGRRTGLRPHHGVTPCRACGADAAGSHLRAQCFGLDERTQDRAGPCRRKAGARDADTAGPVPAHRFLHRCAHVLRSLRDRHARAHRGGRAIPRPARGGWIHEHRGGAPRRAIRTRRR